MEKGALLFSLGSIFFIIAFCSQNLVYAQQQLPLQALSVNIMSPSIGQSVPVGDLAIVGTSTGNAASKCQVYVGWDGLQPYQKATAVGPGGEKDYSNWTFTYTNSYHPITKGMNVLTAELLCTANSTNLIKTSFLTVTGVASSSSNTFSAASTVSTNQTGHHHHSGTITNNGAPSNSPTSNGGGSSLQTGGVLANPDSGGANPPLDNPDSGGANPPSPDGSQPDANGNCVTPSQPDQNQQQPSNPDNGNSNP